MVTKDILKISNVEVYGLKESLVRSGYPMKSDVGTMVLPSDISSSQEIKRGQQLSAVLPGTGHDKFLRGIVVQYDLTAPRYFFQEFDTYHFQESISSQSTLHCLLKFGIDTMCNKHVLPETVATAQKLIDNYKKNPTDENFFIAKSNLPEGLMLTRGVSSSYAQLKTQYLQRRNHRLPEWHVFCDWIETLPCAKELIIGGN